MRESRKSVLLVFLASVCFSTGGLFIKLTPWSGLAINGARNLIGSGVIGIYLLITKHKLVFSRQVFIGALSMIGVTTLILSFIGVAAGNKFGAKYEKKAQILGGAVLIGIGIKIVLEHFSLWPF